MGLVRYSQNSFTSGEFSPLMKGQTSYERYYSAVDTMRNMNPLPQGPAEKRGGFQYLGVANLATAGTTRLIEFIAAEDDALVIEIDSDNIRFWKNDGTQVESGGSPYELTSWFSSAEEVFDAHYTQEGSTVFIFHPNHYPRRLQRIANDDWQLSEASFITEPYTEDFLTPATTLTLSATTGAAVTATAGASTFQNGDVYRFIRYNGGYGVITAFTSATQVTISVLSDFSTTSIASGDWELYGSRFADGGGLVFTLSGDPIYGASGSVATTNNCFRSGDVGKYIEVANGVLRITAYNSATSVDVTLMTALDNKSTTQDWALYKPAWESAGDYPATGCFHEQRLVMAGALATSLNRNKVFMSRPNDFTRFDNGADDNDGISVTLGGRANQIRWIESSRSLIVGTVGDERDISSTDNGPLTPSTLSSRVRTRWGSSKVKPVVIDNEAVFVQRSRKNVRNILFNSDYDTYTSTELSFYAEHISGLGVKELALQDDPVSTIWAVTDDGQLAALAYKPEESVLGWSLHQTKYSTWDAVIESVAVIPGSGGDQVWVSVRRQTGASTYVKYIERINADNRKAYCDSWVKFTAVSASTTVTGLDHLEGLTVTVVNNGAVEADKTVSSGQITLDNAPASGDVIYVGLPYTSTLTMLEPEGGIGNGNSQGISKRCARSMVRVYDTGVFNINGKTVSWRDASMSMGEAPDRKTGDVHSDSGTTWDGKAKYSITSTLAVPLTVVMIAYHLDASMKQ